MQVIKVADLHYKGGGSDKVYHIAILSDGKSWQLNTAYGRRGSTLNKSAKSCSEQQARKDFDRITTEKICKGYGSAPGISGDVFGAGSKFVAKHIWVDEAEMVATVPKPEASHLPQLLNAIDEAAAIKLIADDAWVMQEKFDGRRLAIKSNGKVVQGINRKGQFIEPMAELVDEVLWDAGSYLIDGEAIGSTLYAFDLLELDGIDIRKKGYIHRHTQLAQMVCHSDFSKIWVAPLAITTAEKAALFERVKAEHGEGVVFKRAYAVYEPGRPNSGGNQLKFKFWAQETFKVMNDNGTTRSVFLGAYDVAGATWIDVGKVTIPSNHEMPPVDSFVEVRYLYWYPGGSLYQPQFEGQRTDVDEFDCDIKKLKIKQGEEDDA